MAHRCELAVIRGSSSLEEMIWNDISPANTFFHQLLPVSSFMGVATLPLWTILTGFQLLKKRRLAAIA
jgi:hypothetical protein